MKLASLEKGNVRRVYFAMYIHLYKYRSTNTYWYMILRGQQYLHKSYCCIKLRGLMMMLMLVHTK